MLETGSSYNGYPNDRRYFIVHKPYGMVSQFNSPHPVNLLGGLDFNFPEGTHAIGRLDKDSEGLLLLTTNKKVTRLLFQGNRQHKRAYLVQVKNVPSADCLHKLKTGIQLLGKGGQPYITKPADATVTEKPANLFSTDQAFSEYTSSSWLNIVITEGKFHQVRKMVAAVRHPCLRLIRLSIADIKLGDLQPGCIKEMTEKDFFEQLNIASG